MQFRSFSLKFSDEFFIDFAILEKENKRIFNMAHKRNKNPALTNNSNSDEKEVASEVSSSSSMSFPEIINCSIRLIMNEISLTVNAITSLHASNKSWTLAHTKSVKQDIYCMTQWHLHPFCNKIVLRFPSSRMCHWFFFFRIRFRILLSRFFLQEMMFFSVAGSVCKHLTHIPSSNLLNILSMTSSCTFIFVTHSFCSLAQFWLQTATNQVNQLYIALVLFFFGIFVLVN